MILLDSGVNASFLPLLFPLLPSSTFSFYSFLCYLLSFLLLLFPFLPSSTISFHSFFYYFLSFLNYFLSTFLCYSFHSFFYYFLSFLPLRFPFIPQFLFEYISLSPLSLSLLYLSHLLYKLFYFHCRVTILRVN